LRPAGAGIFKSVAGLEHKIVQVKYSAKVVSLVLNKFSLVAVAIARIFAVLKIGIQ
jgi:hypothetical protein